MCGYNVTVMKRGGIILVRVDDYVYNGVEKILGESRDLGMTKSECIFEIHKVFFEVNKQRKILIKSANLL
jgi:hypothetical protein